MVVSWSLGRQTELVNVESPGRGSSDGGSGCGRGGGRGGRRIIEVVEGGCGGGQGLKRGRKQFPGGGGTFHRIITRMGR